MGGRGYQGLLSYTVLWSMEPVVASGGSPVYGPPVSLYCMGGGGG